MVVTKLRKILIPAVALTLVAAAALTIFGGGDDRKTLVAHFPRTISIYEGSDVRVLGVPVGSVDTVEPSGTDVVVTMSYDAERDLPADAKALIIAPAIVGDRFIQIGPVYEGGETLPDGAELGVERTGAPLELDEIFAALNDLNVALGPRGANKDGALSDLLVQTAENFAGQGEAFNQTIEDFGKFSATLEDNKEELFGASRELNNFLSTLANNDQTVRDFNQSLASVSELLAGERQELTAMLDNLGTALKEVRTFVKDNRAVLGRDIEGLNRVTKILVRRRGALDEILQTAPLALNNLALTYNPQAGTLDTRANTGRLAEELVNNPALVLCTFANEVDQSGSSCDAIKAGLPRAGALQQQSGSEPDRFDQSLAGLVEVDR